MSVDVWTPYDERTNPYTHLVPFRIDGQDFVLSKGQLFFAMWLRCERRQEWQDIRSNMHRFPDRRIAWEYARFLDSEPSRLDGDTKILTVESIRNTVIPRFRPSRYAPYDEQRRSILKYLLTYDGILPKAKGAGA